MIIIIYLNDRDRYRYLDSDLAKINIVVPFGILVHLAPCRDGDLIQTRPNEHSTSPFSLRMQTETTFANSWILQPQLMRVGSSSFYFCVRIEEKEMLGTMRVIEKEKRRDIIQVTVRAT